MTIYPFTRMLHWLLLLLLAISCVHGRTAQAEPPLAEVKSCALPLGVTLTPSMIEQLSAYDLVVLDGEGATAEHVAQVSQNGAIVLAYLSVGTIEPWRSWYSKLKKYRLAYWREWGEWYVKVKEPGFQRQLLQQILPRILKKGFDGIFIDNYDMIVDYPSQKSGMRTLVKKLSQTLHGKNKILFAQNGFSVIQPSVPYLDGWNREGPTADYLLSPLRYRAQSAKVQARTQHELRTMAQKGLFIMSTDYTGSDSDSLTQLARDKACQIGSCSFVSDRLLRRVPAPYICD